MQPAALQSSVAKKRGTHQALLLPSHQTCTSYVTTATTYQAQHIPAKCAHCFYPGSDEPQFTSFLLADRFPSKKNVPHNSLARQHQLLSSAALMDGGEGP